VFGHKPTFKLCPITGHNLPPNLAVKDMLVIARWRAARTTWKSP